MHSSSKMFKDKLIESYLRKFTKDDIPDFESKWHRMKMWRKSCMEGNLERTKETAIQGTFMLQVFEYVLGYTTQTSTEDDMYYQTQEYKNVLDASEADGAIGFFSKRSNEKDVRAVIELKDAKKNLDKKQNRSSHLTPVEQAFMYANKNGSNCA